MGRAGGETTLWPVPKDFFDKKLAILCLQTNLAQLLSKVLYKIPQRKHLEVASELFVSKTEKNVSRANIEGDYAHPYADF